MNGTSGEVEPFLIPLKEKYCVARNHKCGKYKGRTGNSNGRQKGMTIAAQLQATAKKGRK